MNNLMEIYLRLLQEKAIENWILKQAVEKDWWVSVVLKALSKSSVSDFFL